VASSEDVGCDSKVGLQVTNEDWPSLTGRTRSDDLNEDLTSPVQAKDTRASVSMLLKAGFGLGPKG